MADTANSVDWQQWMDYARDDKKACSAMVKLKYSRGILLCTHQMLEHSLKAAWLRVEHKLPRKTHSLSELADSLTCKGLALTDKERDLLRLLDSYFIPLKYPQQDVSLPAHQDAANIFNAAARLFARVTRSR